MSGLYQHFPLTKPVTVNTGWCYRAAGDEWVSECGRKAYGAVWSGGRGVLSVSRVVCSLQVPVSILASSVHAELHSVTDVM